MIAPNQLMVIDDVVAFFALANTKSTLPHRPFLLSKFVPRREVNERGEFDPNAIYQFGDQVEQFGYRFICLQSGSLNNPPLDPVTRNPNNGWVQPWQDAYQRLRDSVKEIVADSFPGVDFWRQSISGPWPCQFPDLNYDELAFYFEDRGRAESVTVSGNVVANCTPKMTFQEAEIPLNLKVDGDRGGFPFDEVDVEGDPVSGVSTTTDTAKTGPPGQFKYRFVDTAEFVLVIGGTRDVHVNLTCSVAVDFIQGTTVRDDSQALSATYDNTPPASLIDIDTSKWLPAGWTNAGVQFGRMYNDFLDNEGLSPFAYAGTLQFTCQYNGTLSPGRYTVKFRYNGTINNRASGVLTFSDDHSTGTLSTSGFNEWAFNTFGSIEPLMAVVGTIDFVANQEVEVPGVDDAHRVMKIEVNDFGGLGPSAVISTEQYYDNPKIDGTPNIERGVVVPWTGIGSITKIAEDATPYTNPAFLFERQTLGVRDVGFNTSTTGFWFAKTPPVQSLGLCPFDRMPWNIFPTDQFGHVLPNVYLGYKPPYLDSQTPSYASDGPGWIVPTANNEMLPWPKLWKANTTYPAGYAIMDGNGNLQTAEVGGRSGDNAPNWPTGKDATVQEPNFIDGSGTHPGVKWKLTRVLAHENTISRGKHYAVGDVGWDDNGNKQTVTAAGTTALNSPDWSRVAGGLTVDGTVTWKAIYIGTIAPAVAKISPPNYPVFWQNPSAGQTDPAPNLGNWSSTDIQTHPVPYGWWIYRVALNRLPPPKEDGTPNTDKPPTDPIPVSIGCIRNGAFVSFGTFNTGQIINAYWPVFTNTALCYQASERVDIQAAILTCGVGYGTWGHVDFPFAAAYLNDMTTLLGMIQ